MTTALRCYLCALEKAPEDFSKDKKNTARHGRTYGCKACVSEKLKGYYQANKENRKRTYGLTLSQYKQMLIDQKHECAICSREIDGTTFVTHLDHDHKTGKARAFLCINCNQGLGQFKDKPELLELAAKYLRKHES